MLLIDDDDDCHRSRLIKEKNQNYKQQKNDDQRVNLFSKKMSNIHVLHTKKKKTKTNQNSSSSSSSALCDIHIAI